MSRSVCIIGAGPSGITTAKTFHEKGIAFDCYEKGSKIGGVWRYNNDNGLSSAYRSLHINTNKDIMAFSDFPLPAHYPMFPHHSQIIRYFEDYVAYFGIADKITFNTTVTEVLPQPDGRWLVKTDTGISKLYDHVVVANGHHWNPRYPDFPGTFAGETMHVHYYRTPEQILNKDLLIVGIGNSAVDIACEAAKLHSGQVTISTRSGAYIMPNYFLSTPFDKLANPLTAKLPMWIQRKLLNLTLYLARGRQEDYGVPKPKRDILHEHPTVSQELLNLSGRGLISYKPNIKKLDGHEVEFEDGTRQRFDMIMYCTGYKITFPFLKEKAFDVAETNAIELYNKVVHPNYPNLYFIGLVQALGALMPLSEVQAKWVAQVINRTIQLPSAEEMRQILEKQMALIKKRYIHSPRHTIQVDFHAYKASIEKQLKR